MEQMPRCFKHVQPTQWGSLTSTDFTCFGDLIPKLLGSTLWSQRRKHLAAGAVFEIWVEKHAPLTVFVCNVFIKSLALFRTAQRRWIAYSLELHKGLRNVLQRPGIPTSETVPKICSTCEENMQDSLQGSGVVSSRMVRDGERMWKTVANRLVIADWNCLTRHRKSLEGCDRETSWWLSWHDPISGLCISPGASRITSTENAQGPSLFWWWVDELLICFSNLILSILDFPQTLRMNLQISTVVGCSELFWVVLSCSELLWVLGMFSPCAAKSFSHAETSCIMRSKQKSCASVNSTYLSMTAVTTGSEEITCIRQEHWMTERSISTYIHIEYSNMM